MLVSKRIPIKPLIKRTWATFLAFVIYTMLIYMLDEHYGQSYLDIPPTIPGFLGTGISIFLAFITNSAYDRWWEARKLWGAIVNDSRTLVRQLRSFTAEHFQEHSDMMMEHYTRMSHRQIAWNYLLANALRKLPPNQTGLQYLSSEERDIALQRSNIPATVLESHSAHIAEMRNQNLLTDYQAVQLETVVQRLCDSMGGCERIKGTIFPRHYGFFIHMFILAFLALLPLGFIEEFGWFSIVVSGSIGLIFLLIEAFEVTMQDPFDGESSDTAMLTISRNIEINLLEELEVEDIPEQLQPVKGVLM